MSAIRRNASLADVAAIVSDSLADAGIVATLSGGSAVSLYSDNAFLSKDLDFVTASMLDELVPVMTSLGFEHAAKPRLSVFTHPLIEWYVEFVPAPLSFGNTVVDATNCAVIETDIGRIRIISPTQCVMDRLASHFSWGDAQAREQAVRVAATNQIDWPALKAWIASEGESAEQFQQFRGAVENVSK